MMVFSCVTSLLFVIACFVMVCAAFAWGIAGSRETTQSTGPLAPTTLIVSGLAGIVMFSVLALVTGILAMRRTTAVRDSPVTKRG